MIFIFLGGIVYLVGAIGLLIDEFREGVAWGLLGLFTQIGHFIFALVHFDRCKKSLGFILLGIIMVIVGVVSTPTSSKTEYYEPQASFQTQSHDDVQLPAYRKEYHAGSQLPVGSRKAAPICADWPETGYWLSTNSGKRHNPNCENYRKTRGYPCTKDEGKPCGKCGG